MSHNFIIDSASCIGKFAIEQTKLHPIAKLSINFSIDLFAKHLKSNLLSDTEKICNTAEQFNVDKVVAIPIGTLNSKIIVAIRVYGGNTAAFIKHLGLQFISENENNNFVNRVLESEKNFGVVIYQKSN